MLNQGELLPYRDQFKVSSRAKKSNRFTPCRTCRLLTGCPSQASDPSRCDAPHRTPPATLSSFQVPQGTQHSSLFAFCTFCSPGSNALFLTPRYPFRLSSHVIFSGTPDPLPYRAPWLLPGEYDSPSLVLVQHLSSMLGRRHRCLVSLRSP